MEIKIEHPYPFSKSSIGLIDNAQFSECTESVIALWLQIETYNAHLQEAIINIFFYNTIYLFLQFWHTVPFENIFLNELVTASCPL